MYIFSIVESQAQLQEISVTDVKMKFLGVILLVSLTEGVTEPLSEEVFECPAESRLTPICQMKLGNQCSSDDDCDIWQSCCEAGCGNRCVMKLKFEGHGGTCPHSSRLHYVCKMNFTAPCENDDSCGHWASCCKTECGSRCVPECLAKKPTDQCPTEDRLSIFCQMSTGDSCEENKDCDAFHTCCDADCGKKCIPKCFTGVNGTCPVSRRLTMMCDMTLGNDCSNDTQCDIWQMCCKTSCGAKCVPTFINKCEHQLQSSRHTLMGESHTD
ncbi:WAP four-disulfide core domain protein 3-like [Scyliorhinus canicula]|uniref:WAP four-disulfide core domain protein 3-like n=1 Tax=Scyliorhinus canicula TaxID=7830 RepID=UPI0018F5229E|nr:WAP four-disulfide core domain protein 3-like [Scyliorhinus canicula]